MSKRQQRYAEAAKVEGLLIAEHEGVCMGIGTRDELQGLIDEGIMPTGTILRAARADDF